MIVRQEDMTREFALRVIQHNRTPQGYVTVEFEDGLKDLPIQLVVLHCPVWEIFRHFGIPVTTSHISHKVSPMNKKSFMKMVSSTYSAIFPMAKTYEDIQELKDAIWEVLNFYDDLGSTELNEYNCSISLIDLVKLVSQPKVKEIIDVDLDPAKGTKYIESTMANATEKLIKLLSTRGELEENILLDYMECSLLNANQIPQVLIAFGLRTEVNDTVIKLPVTGSSLSGMKNIMEMAVEHQAARKAVYYSHTAIRTSQYFGRKQHLNACIIAKVYDDDCGTTETLPVDITPSNYKNYISKIIRTSDGDVALVNENIKNYVDTTVNMYSPITCRHTDGVCAKCFGLLSKNLPKGMNIGINAASQMVSQVSQKILSTKHFIKTKSQVYIIPTGANTYLERINSGIALKKMYLKAPSEWYMGFSFKDIKGSITDLHHITEEYSVPEERYSDIQSMFICTPDGAINEHGLVVDGQSPFLTNEFLLYMKEKYNDLKIEDEVIWIPMKDINQIPIFRTTISNDSMMAYVQTVSYFLENGRLAKYHNAADALRDFSDIIYSQVDVNIVYIETILKAHLITSSDNYSVPIVTDYTNVLFDNTVDIIANRTISCEYALQGLKKFLSTPGTYCVRKDTSVFDRFFGI